MVSGVVNSLDEIRRGLLKRRHTPFLFAPLVRGYRERHAGVFRFPSVDIDPSVEFPMPIPYSARLSRLVGRMDLELIHSHHPILVGATAANFARRLNIPLVYTFHTQIEEYSHYVPFFKQQTVKDMARAKVKRYLARCDLVICPSPVIREVIDSYGIDTRVETVANAIDLEKFRAPAEGTVPTGEGTLRQRLGLSPESLVSLSVGRLAPEKGLPFLIDAFSRLDPTLDHHLVVVGSGLQRSELEGIVKQKELSHRIHFLGRIPYSEMPAYYAQADLFVICSTTEVKPLVVLEALASGTPVLAVAACGTTDTLTHEVDGLLCPLDGGVYTEAWGRLLSDHAFRLQLAEAAPKTARRFSIESYLDRLCELYTETHERFHKRRAHPQAIS